MTDYIDRQATIDKINERQRKLIYCFGFENDAVKIMDIAKSIVSAIPSEQPELESADVAPVVHGKWLPIVSYNNTYKCSECGRLLVDITDGLKMVSKHYPYCHCGAKMDGGELDAAD